MKQADFHVNSTPSRNEIVWLPIVLIALLAIYLPALGNAPVFDDQYLADGELFREYATFEPRVRMLSYGSFVWVQSLFGEGWWKQRLVNLLIHFGVVVALWGFYREILRCIAPPPMDSSGAAATALPAYHRSPALGIALAFFALNPVAVYAVAYLIQRSILLATFFVVLGLWAFAAGLRTQRVGLRVALLAAALVSYLLAMMSKEYALLAPLAAVPVYILLTRPSAKRLAFVTAAGIAIIVAIATILVQRYGELIGKPFDEYSSLYLAQLAKLDPDAQRLAYPLSILNEAYLFFQYGLRWLFPYEGWMSINLRPPFPVRWLTFPHILGIFGYCALLVGGFVLLFRYRDWRALIGISILLPALLYGTEFSTVWVQDPFVLYRSYLWAIGIPGLVFFLVEGQKPAALAAIGAVLGLLLVWQSLDRVFSLATPEKAWTDAIKKLPNDPRSVGRWFPYLNRGSLYAETDQIGLAMVDFDTSAALGDQGMGATNLGAMLSSKRKFREALAAFDRAEQQGYNLYNLPFQRGLALAALGRPAEAYAQFEKARSMNPPSPTRELVLLQSARAAMQLRKGEEAAASLEQLLRLDPRHEEGKYLMGMALIMREDYTRAIERLTEFLLEKASGRLYYARAMAHLGLKNRSEALGDIEAAIRMDPRNRVFLEWRDKILAMPR